MSISEYIITFPTKCFTFSTKQTEFHFLFLWNNPNPSFSFSGHTLEQIPVSLSLSLSLSLSFRLCSLPLSPLNICRVNGIQGVERLTNCQQKHEQWLQQFHWRFGSLDSRWYKFEGWDIAGEKTLNIFWLFPLGRELQTGQISLNIHCTLLLTCSLDFGLLIGFVWAYKIYSIVIIPLSPLRPIKPHGKISMLNMKLPVSLFMLS